VIEVGGYPAPAFPEDLHFLLSADPGVAGSGEPLCAPLRAALVGLAC